MPSDDLELEKAKMDHQHDLDKKKLREERRLGWCPLIVEKVIIGVAAGILGVVGYYHVNRSLDRQRDTEAHALESFKIEESRKRFMMEKRLEAMVDISVAHNAMKAPFFRYFEVKGSAADDAIEAHKAGINKFLDAANRHSVLLTEEFGQDTNRYLNVHRFLKDVGPSKWGRYRELASDLDNEFGELCQSYMETQDAALLARMKLKPITFAERIKMSPEQYLEAQFAWHEKNKPKK